MIEPTDKFGTPKPLPAKNGTGDVDPADLVIFFRVLFQLAKLARWRFALALIFFAGAFLACDHFSLQAVVKGAIVIASIMVGALLGAPIDNRAKKRSNEGLRQQYARIQRKQEKLLLSTHTKLSGVLDQLAAMHLGEEADKLVCSARETVTFAQSEIREIDKDIALSKPSGNIPKPKRIPKKAIEPDQLPTANVEELQLTDRERTGRRKILPQRTAEDDERTRNSK